MLCRCMLCVCTQSVVARPPVDTTHSQKAAATGVSRRYKNAVLEWRMCDRRCNCCYALSMHGLCMHTRYSVLVGRHLSSKSRRYRCACLGDMRMKFWNDAEVMGGVAITSVDVD